jgi:hypothetical protein
MVDRRINIFPNEEIYTDALVKEYCSLDGTDKETLERFYKRTNTIDAFIVNGELRTGIDIDLFDLTLRSLFKIRKRAMAGDNLYQYLPLAEDRLLIKTGERNGSFNLSVAERNGLFDWHRVRQMLKDTYLDSLKWHPGIVYEVGRMGLNKGAPRIKGYTPILKEIRHEWLEGKYEL